MQRDFRFQSWFFGRGFLTYAFFALLAAAIVGQEPVAKADIEPLVLGKQIDREMIGGQKHEYTVSVVQDQLAKILVEEKGIDVLLRVLDPEGKMVSQEDGSKASARRMTLQFISSRTASYQIEVTSRVSSAIKGSYSIVLQDLHAASDNDRSLQESSDLLGQVIGLIASGNYKEAVPLAERALEIREKILDPDDPAVAVVLGRLGVALFYLGDDVKAEGHFKRAIDIYEKKYGPDDITLTDPLNNISIIYRERGEFSKAEETMLRVLSIREKTLGEDNTNVAAILTNLGNLYMRRGDYGTAVKMYERAIGIRERIFSADDISLAPPLSGLSTVYYLRGDYAGSIKLDKRVLAIKEKNLRPDHPEIASALGNLALNYTNTDDFQSAEPLYKRALTIDEKNFGSESPDYATAEFNFAIQYLRRGDYEKARPLYEHSLAVAQKNREGEPLSLAIYEAGFGEFCIAAGDYERAEKLLTEALEIREKILGPEHKDVGLACDLLAKLYALKGNPGKALEFQTRAAAINEKNIALNLSIGTEHQKLSYMTGAAKDLNQTIALQSLLPKNNEIVNSLAVSGVLQQKGRVLDAVSSSMSVLRQRAAPGDQSLFDKLNDTNARLSELELNGAPDLPYDQRKIQIAVLQEIKDKVETDISKLTSGYFERLQPITLSSIQAEIPADSALIEFASYSPITAKPNLSDDRRYVAYIIRRDGAPKWIELGKCAEIDKMVASLRSALRDAKHGDVKSLARALDKRIMQPVRDLSGNAKHFLISPDGELSLIPFEALVDQQQQYLIENYAFTYLTSGRDLLRMKIPRESRSGPLLVADPAFGTRAGETAKAVAANVRKVSFDNREPERRKNPTVLRDISDAYFTPLAGTAAEARSIQSLFPDARLLIGAEASETALKQAIAPSILHIATHGFFIDSGPALLGGPAANGRSFLATSSAENPLLRSGLALTGANRRTSGSDDGILTALEASGLDLWGTKLVVLSACDTGIGEIKTGEGVYGLRRAFVEAGAESLVMSLWPVSDVVVRDLMMGYYRYLKQGRGRGEALRRVQLDMLKRPERRHPFYWASFIQAGEWANLDAKR